MSKPSSRGKPLPAPRPTIDLTKRAVVHVEHAPPGDAPLIEAERVAPVHVIVDHRRKQIVRRCYGVKVASEVEVDLLHRRDLGAAAAGRAPFYPEAGPERRLAQTDDRLLADAVERVAEADGGRRLALAGGGRADRADKDELAIRAVLKAAEKIIFELGDEAAEWAQRRFGRANLRGDLGDRLQARRARDFEIRRHGIDASPWIGRWTAAKREPTNRPPRFVLQART